MSPTRPTRKPAAPKRAKPKPASKPAAKSAKTSAPAAAAPGLITARIAELGDWRGDVLAHARKLIRAADPAVVEEWKWGVPVWSHDGILCTGETYKAAVKFTFAKGASLPDPAKLFTSSLEGNTRRAMDVREGEKIRETPFKQLVRAAVALNLSGRKG